MGKEFVFAFSLFKSVFSISNNKKREKEQRLSLYKIYMDNWRVCVSNRQILLDNLAELRLNFGEPQDTFGSYLKGDLSNDKSLAIVFLLVCHNQKLLDEVIGIFENVDGEELNELRDAIASQEFLEEIEDKRLLPLSIASLPTSPSAPFEWPPYVSEEKAFSEDADEGIWLNPHNHYSIPLFGREKEIEQLNEFINDRSPFLICALIASSGAGKTRLVSEWMKSYVPSAENTVWDAGIVKTRDVDVWKNWVITKNTLIIIDYTYNYDEVIQTIKDKCSAYKAHKVRLLVIDHVFPDVLNKDFIWQPSFEHQGVTDSHEDTIFYQHSPIELKGEKEDSTLLRYVIACAASLENVQYIDPEDRKIIYAEQTLHKMGESAANRDSVRHPLFAALLGQAIRDGKDYTNWTRRDLIKHYFDKPHRIPWVIDRKRVNQYAETLGPWIGSYVSVATLRRGIDIRLLKSFLPTEIKKDRSDINDADKIAQFAKRIVSSNDDDTLKPLEPDILGENFLLMFLKLLKDDKDLRDTFMQMLCAAASDDEAEEASVNIVEVIQHLTRNLANDIQNLDEVKKAWQHLIAFLDPQNLDPKYIPAESTFRQAISIALVEVIKQLKSANWNEAADISPSKINSEDLVCASSVALWKEASSAFIHYFEWVTEKNLSDEKLRKQFLTTVNNFKERSKNKWTGLMHCAHEGCSRATTYIFDHLKEDVNAKNKEGWTALMMASHQGHLDVVSLLLERKADVNQGRTDNGWTALMVASHQGHLDVVSLLLERKADVNQGRTDNDGWTALLLASVRGHGDVVSLLLEWEANVNQGTADNGGTALMAASQEGHHDVVSLLLEWKADVNQATNEGWTALMSASHGGHHNVVSLLLNTKANTNQTDYHGNTALIYAQEQGHDEVVKILQSATQ